MFLVFSKMQKATEDRTDAARQGYRTKAQVAADVIRDAILEGKLRPAQRLFLKDLRANLGLSVTPVREGLRSLVAEGLVVDDPYRGMSVARLDVADAVEIYDIRSWLEPKATELAAEQLSPALLLGLTQLNDTMRRRYAEGDLRAVQLANRRFHMDLYRASGREHLCDVITQLWRRFPWGTLRTVPGRVDIALAEHEAILHALEGRHPVEAAEAMRRHLESASKALQGRFRAAEVVSVIADTTMAAHE
jgi:DNA-binding GntR family transcriptional regulator